MSRLTSKIERPVDGYIFLDFGVADERGSLGELPTTLAEE
jgi:hypothetical protein